MSRSKLSEVKATTGPFVLPSESLQKILEVAGNRVEILEYFQASLIKKIANNPVYDELSHEVMTLVDSARHQDDQQTRLSPWSAKPDLPERLLASFDKSEFTAFQDFLVSREIGKLETKLITMDYAVNESAQYMRGYSGNNLKDGDINAMDTLFNAWLSKQGMMMRSGGVYAATKEGEPVKNSDNKVVAEQLDKLLQDKQRGFAAYVKDKAPDVKLDIRKAEYPSQQIEPS